MSTSPLNLEETLAMAEVMAALADKDAGVDEDAGYWDGWADGLRQLLSHQRSGVKATCFPIGSCACHPFRIGRPR
jgi:hypothetical protein